MADMEDAASDQTPDDAGRDHKGQDRRNTIDLVRVERGEPERRALRRPVKPSEDSE